MFGFLLVACMAAAEIPVPALTEMSFARLIATRLGMHFAHGAESKPERLEIGALNGRVHMAMGGQLLLIGKVRTALSRRLRPTLRDLKRAGPLTLIVIPPHGEALSEWITRTSRLWSSRHPLLAKTSGVAPADLLDQRAFNDWDADLPGEAARAPAVTYSDVLYGEVPDLPAAYRERAMRELAVLGLGTPVSTEDLVSLNDFLARPSCGENLR